MSNLNNETVITTCQTGNTDNGQFHNCQSWSFITVLVNFNSIDKDDIVSWQSDLENTKESILPVCDNPYHKIKENMPHGRSLKNCGTIFYPSGQFSVRTFLCSLFFTPGQFSVRSFAGPDNFPFMCLHTQTNLRSYSPFVKQTRLAKMAWYQLSMVPVVWLPIMNAYPPPHHT